MPTFADLATEVLSAVNDDGTFHTSANVITYLRAGEALLSLSRGLIEVTADLTLTGAYAYHIHDFFPRFIRPLRITVNEVVLVPTSLEKLSLTDPYWSIATDQPESWCMIGGTYLVLAPIAGAGTATITYLAHPDTAATTPTVQTQWHRTLSLFAQALCLGKESQFAMATAKMKEFLAMAGIPDARFLATSAMRPRKETEQPVTVVQD